MKRNEMMKCNEVWKYIMRENDIWYIETMKRNEEEYDCEIRRRISDICV